MMIRSALVPAALCATFALSPLAATAQEAAAAGAQDAQPQVPAGPEVAATFRDWQILCTTVDAAGTQSCEMYQLLHDQAGSAIAEISIVALPFGADFAAGVTVTTPLETFLPTGMGWYVGERPADGQMRVEGFRVCTVVGCIVRMGLSPDEIDTMKAGANATIMIAPFVAINQPVAITVSLAGFTAAYEDLQTRLANAAAAARSNN